MGFGRARELVRVIVNRYPGTCGKLQCTETNRTVRAGSGKAIKDRGAWRVFHGACVPREAIEAVTGRVSCETAPQCGCCYA